MSYKRLALVDPRFIIKDGESKSSLKSTPTPPVVAPTNNELVAADASLQPHAPLLEVLVAARRELNEALDDNEASLSDKMVKYSEALNRIQVLMRKHKLQNVENEAESLWRKKISLNSTEDVDSVLSRLLKAIPVNNKSKTKRLYKFLLERNDIKWDRHGKITSIDGAPVLGADIVELLADVSRQRKKMVTRPPGAPQLQNLLARINPKFDLVKNQLYHSPLYAGAPLYTPAQPIGGKRRLESEPLRPTATPSQSGTGFKRQKIRKWLV